MKRVLIAAVVAALGLTVPLGAAERVGDRGSPQSSDQARPKNGQHPAKTAANVDELKDALEQVRDAADVAKKMAAQPEMPSILKSAKGVFLVPNYGGGAVIVGGSGGQGVLVAHKPNGGWSNPVFYNLGSVSVGVQAGVKAGQIAMVILSDRALNSFKGNTTFSLNADAGWTIINYSARGQADIGKGDVLFWTDTEGAFAGVRVGASAISADEDANRAYYSAQNVAPSDILSGKVAKARPEANALNQALSSAVKTSARR